ncbi:unnamed protein product [Urochloa humidicola]
MTKTDQCAYWKAFREVQEQWRHNKQIMNWEMEESCQEPDDIFVYVSFSTCLTLIGAEACTQLTSRTLIDYSTRTCKQEHIPVEAFC